MIDAGWDGYPQFLGGCSASFLEFTSFMLCNEVSNEVFIEIFDKDCKSDFENSLVNHCTRILSTTQFFRRKASIVMIDLNLSKCERHQLELEIILHNAIEGSFKVQTTNYISIPGIRQSHQVRCRTILIVHIVQI